MDPSEWLTSDYISVPSDKYEGYNYTVIPAYVDVTFDPNYNGAKAETVSTHLFEKVAAPEDPKRADHIFKGWYKDPGCSEKWNFDEDTVEEKMTLYGGRCKHKIAKIASKGNKVTSIKVSKLGKKKLKSHKAYKFYVAAIGKDGKVISKSNVAHVVTAKTYGRKFANATKITAKKNAVTLKAGKNCRLSAAVKVTKGRKQLSKGHAKPLRFASDNKAIATVDSGGNVKGIRPGKCTVYIQAVNGLWCKTTVTVVK